MDREFRYIKNVVEFTFLKMGKDGVEKLSNKDFFKEMAEMYNSEYKLFVDKYLNTPESDKKLLKRALCISVFFELKERELRIERKKGINSL